MAAAAPRPRRLSYLSEGISVHLWPGATTMEPICIAGVMDLDRAVPLEELRARVKDRLLPLERFRAVIVDEGRQGVCMRPLAAEEVDLEYHVARADLKAGASDDELSAFVCGAQLGSFEAGAPRWRALSVDKLKDGRAALVLLIDHCVVDGVAAVAALNALFDETQMAADAPLEASCQPERRAQWPAMPVSAAAFGLAQGAFEGLFGPLIPADDPSSLKLTNHRVVSADKCAAFSEPVDLATIRLIKSKFPGATVNDVLLAAMTVCVEGYMAAKGEPRPRRMRGIFPVNMRPTGMDVLREGLGNHFCTGKFRFPLHLVQDPEALVWAIKRQVDLIKISPGRVMERALVSRALPALVGRGCIRTVNDLLLDIHGKCTSMLSNVVGPLQPVHLLGRTVTDLRYFTFAPIGVYFGLMSYGGKVRAGVVTDPQCERAPERLAGLWGPAVARLHAAAMRIEGESKAPPAPGALSLAAVVAQDAVALVCGAFGAIWRALARRVAAGAARVGARKEA